MRCRLCAGACGCDSSSVAPSADLICESAYGIVLSIHSKAVQDESRFAASLVCGLEKYMAEVGALVVLGLERGVKSLGEHSDPVHALGQRVVQISSDSKTLGQGPLVGPSGGCCSGELADLLELASQAIPEQNSCTHAQC